MSTQPFQPGPPRRPLITQSSQGTQRQKQQRMKLVKRAFTGLAGSPLAHVDVQEQPNKRGRPPKEGAKTAAERGREFRKRQQQTNPQFAEQEAKRKENERNEAWRQARVAEIARTQFALDPGPRLIAREAPRGKGLIITGGYGGQKINVLIGRMRNGRVSPKGYGASDFEKNDGSGLYEKVRRIDQERLSDFAPVFPPTRDVKILRRHIYGLMIKTGDGRFMCGLCKEILGFIGGADVTAHMQVGFSHMEKCHPEQLDVLQEKLSAKPKKKCSENHERMIEKYGHGSVPLQCKRCRRILWRPMPETEGNFRSDKPSELVA